MSHDGEFPARNADLPANPIPDIDFVLGTMCDRDVWEYCDMQMHSRRPKREQSGIDAEGGVMGCSVRHMWSPAGILLSTFVSPYTRQESCQRARKILGKPFERLPGNPPDAKVLAVLDDGSRVRVSDVQAAYNDWLLAVEVDGAGTYEECYRNHRDRDLGARQLKVLELAQTLYGRVQ